VKQESRPAIRLEQGTAEAIRRHAARAYPDECCGALIGRSGEGCRTVVRTLAIDNARTDSARNRFLVTDRDYLRAEAEAAAHGLDLIGFYHSHPDHVARPSQFDLDHAWPVFSYVIVSVVAGRADLMTSWILEEDRSRFRPQPLREIVPAPRPRPIPAPHPHLRGART
jgi:proteasome lid subunit RPN8/RPN11